MRILKVKAKNRSILFPLESVSVELNNNPYRLYISCNTAEAELLFESDEMASQAFDSFESKAINPANKMVTIEAHTAIYMVKG